MIFFCLFKEVHEQTEGKHSTQVAWQGQDRLIEHKNKRHVEQSENHIVLGHLGQGFLLCSDVEGVGYPYKVYMWSYCVQSQLHK